MTIEHYREFNIDHAKKGAPVGLLSGKPLHILTWDMNDSTIVGLVTINSKEYIEYFTYQGKDPAEETCRAYGLEDKDCEEYEKLVMVPLFFCQEKPVFSDDKLWWHNDARFTPTIIGPDFLHKGFWKTVEEQGTRADLFWDDPSIGKNERWAIVYKGPLGENLPWVKFYNYQYPTEEWAEKVGKEKFGDKLVQIIKTCD